MLSGITDQLLGGDTERVSGHPVQVEGKWVSATLPVPAERNATLCRCCVRPGVWA